MKFTKHISILLAILILVSNIGLAFDVHYCGDSIASVSLHTDLLNDSAVVDCCGVSKKKSSSCKDKVIKFEKKSDNFITKSFNFQSHFDFLIQEFYPIVYTKKSSFKSYKVPSYSCNANGPPIYKRYCQLVFYA